jgi:hypothetical protein
MNYYYWWTSLEEEKLDWEKYTIPVIQVSSMQMLYFGSYSVQVAASKEAIGRDQIDKRLYMQKT